MARELLKRLRDEEGIGKSSVTERGGREWVGLNDQRRHGRQIGTGVEGERDSAELGSHREPSHGAVRKQNVTTSTSGRSWFEAWVIDRKSRRRAKANWKVGKEGMVRVRSCRGGDRRRSRLDDGISA